jgi:monothiol glutaredoxin
MAMAANEIEALIKAALPDARVTVEDLAGDGDHYAASVISEQFRGLTRVKQHQIVYAALRGRMGGELHALALQTSAPEWSGYWCGSRMTWRVSLSANAALRAVSQEFELMTNPTFERIQGDVTANPVMLYMKGTAMFPQCGFSARVVQILTHLGVPFQTANVLEEPELREGIKHFSNWPTIPQLYVNGEFVGGCDIVTEMFQSGELETLLTEKGIPHKAAA